MAKGRAVERDAYEAFLGDFSEIKAQLPAQVEFRAPRGCLPASAGGIKHGWHTVVQIPTSLMCNLCPLYHVRRKNKRHPLACPEGRKNQICPILTHLQRDWACSLLQEIEDVSGSPPTPSDICRVEQIVRHRSRLFQVENFLKLAGVLDLKKGEVRNVYDRLNSTENSLSRSLTEFRQALAERRASGTSRGPKLEDYLKKIEAVGDKTDDDGAGKEK